VVVFDNQSALLSPVGRKTLTDVAAKLRDQRWIVEFRGHVSPFESMRDNTKAMNLSTTGPWLGPGPGRAGLKWETLRVVACGSNDRWSPALRRQRDRATSGWRSW